MIKPKIFIACDTTDIRKIKQIIKLTKNSKISFGYKFGLEFLNSKNGRKFISKLKNKIIFGDYKLADITNTCASAIKAVKAAKKMTGSTKLIGVTILTSLNNKSLKEIGFDKNVKNLVLHQAKLAAKAKLDAIVCSPHEVKYVRKVFKKEIITPGIKLPGDDNKDQKRVMTPKIAFQNGATSLVIGRSLIKGNLSENIQKLIKELK